VTAPIDPESCPTPLKVAVDPDLAMPNRSNRSYLKWNMTAPPHTAFFCSQAGSKGPLKFLQGWPEAHCRARPATLPSVTTLFIVSRTFPWTIPIVARDAARGVTCDDVIEGVFSFLQQPPENATDAPEPQLRVEAGTQSQARIHALDAWMFGGIVANSRLGRGSRAKRIILQLWCNKEEMT
jgi:hypothetical protein